MAKDTINRSLIDSFIPEKVAFQAINKLTSYMNLAKTVYRDFEPEVASEGDTVRVPKYGTLTANEMSQTGVVTLQNPADDEVSIVLNQHWETSFLIRDVAKAMSRPKVLEGYVKNGAIALAEKIENKLAALYASAGDSVSGGAALGLDDLRSLRKKHVDQKVPRLAPKYLYLDSDGFTDLLADANIGDASKFGARSPLISGEIPQLYGYGLFESQNIVTSGSPATFHCLGYVEEAMALVMRPLPNPGDGLGVRSAVVQDPESGVGMRVSYSWDKDHLGVQVTLDVLFGVGVLRDEFLIDVQHT
jgi:hypothetical protein